MPGQKPAYALAKSRARALWLHAQRLDSEAPFGRGPAATLAAVEQLGYVQIDTIHVIERCHHHILYTRIPEYRRSDLQQAQSIDKTVFEYWTHALSYVPVRDARFFVRAMKQHWQQRSAWFSGVTDADLRKVLRLLARGPITIRDIDDDVLVEKEHPWASRKPSKRALQLAFYRGIVTVSQRAGMLKTYDLAPLINQRKRSQLFFGYEHRFEAYVPKDKRVFGYFALPVLIGDEFVALLDLKTDREARRLLMQRWTWLTQRGRRAHEQQIEAALHRFERFQLGVE